MSQCFMWELQIVWLSFFNHYTYGICSFQLKLIVQCPNQIQCYLRYTSLQYCRNNFYSMRSNRDLLFNFWHWLRYGGHDTLCNTNLTSFLTPMCLAHPWLIKPTINSRLTRLRTCAPLPSSVGALRELVLCWVVTIP